MTEQAFIPVPEQQQRRNWQSIRLLREEAKAEKDYALADFYELLEMLITGRHFIKAVMKLTAHAPHTAEPGKWDTLTTAELAKAIELMIAPEDLIIRDAAKALLEVYNYTPEDVREVIREGVYFNAGWAFYGLNTYRPQIINNLAEHPQA